MWHVVFKYILIFIEVAVSALLVAAILIQKPRGHGMGLAFGAGMGESLFGAQVGNVMTRVTVVLSIIFLVNTMLLALMGSGKIASVTDGIKPVPAAAPGPGGAGPAEAGPGAASPSAGIPDAILPPVAPAEGTAPVAAPAPEAPKGESVVVPIPKAEPPAAGTAPAVPEKAPPAAPAPAAGAPVDAPKATPQP